MAVGDDVLVCNDFDHCVYRRATECDDAFFTPITLGLVAAITA